MGAAMVAGMVAGVGAAPLGCWSWTVNASATSMNQYATSPPFGHLASWVAADVDTLDLPAAISNAALGFTQNGGGSTISYNGELFQFSTTPVAVPPSAPVNIVNAGTTCVSRVAPATSASRALNLNDRRAVSMAFGLNPQPLPPEHPGDIPERIPERTPPGIPFRQTLGAPMILEWKEHNGPLPREMMGLGAAPRFHAPTKTWLARRNGDNRVMRYGFGDPAVGTVTAGNSLLTYLSANSDQSSCTSNSIVSQFQTAYNADPNATQQLTVDGLYGANTQAALQAVFPTAWPTGLAVILCGTAPSGGTAPALTGGSTATPTAGSSAAPMSTQTMLLIGAGVLGAGGLAYYLFKKGRR
jgi:hypothetical protein